MVVSSSSGSTEPSWIAATPGSAQPATTVAEVPPFSNRIRLAMSAPTRPATTSVASRNTASGSAPPATSVATRRSADCSSTSRCSDASSRRRSVMSSPMLMTPAAASEPSRSGVFVHEIRRRSPDRVTIQFSLRGLIRSPASWCRNRSRTPDISGGSNVSNQSRPISCSMLQPLSSARYAFANVMRPSRSSAAATSPTLSSTECRRRSNSPSRSPVSLCFDGTLLLGRSSIVIQPEAADVRGIPHTRGAGPVASRVTS